MKALLIAIVLMSGVVLFTAWANGVELSWIWK
jgi:hypothetical protein